MNQKPAIRHGLEVFIPVDPTSDAPRRSQAENDDYVDLQILIQESERQRIAMDLHDGLGPLITLIKLELQNATKLMCEGDIQLDPARAAISRAEENIARTFEELRRTVCDLRPSMLDDLGLLAALRWLIRRFELSGADVEFEGDLAADERQVPAALKIVIFRICQEALNNALKHADASHVKVALVIRGDELSLSIADDGCGIRDGSQGAASRPRGGLAGMIRRADSSNGVIDIASASGAGTRITVAWPLLALADDARENSNSREPQITH